MTHLVYHNPEIVHTYYLLIPSTNSSEFTVLLRKDEDNQWTLPSFQPIEHHFAVVTHINDHIKSTLNLKAATLRCFATNSDAEKGERRFYAIDNLSPDWECPQDFQFFEETELSKIPIQTPLQKQIILEWFDWLHSNNSLRVPWMRPGWFPKIADWMIDLADRMSMQDIRIPKQVRVWARSATVRLETRENILYLKTVPEFFNYEPVITRVLSIRYPEHAPDVRAVHVENGWMLMRAFGGKPLTHIENIDIWKNALREYAKLQIDMVGNTQALVSLGVPDRNVDYLSSQIDRLMRDLPDSLTDDEKRDLRRIAPILRRMCMQLVDFNVPLTITHGDFWSGNTIIKPDNSCLFFDWSDASISHPFFDIITFLTEIENELPDVTDAHEQLLIAYLDPFTRYEPISNLKRMVEMAKVLGSLHQALFYYVHILPRVESAVRWELSGMLPYLLRHVLEAQKSFQQSAR